ncbi:hypothetical protein [Pelotalea chapellei]|nr:hypothetical protein [Pelotalea chapellei]
MHSLLERPDQAISVTEVSARPYLILFAAASRKNMWSCVTMLRQP